MKKRKKLSFFFCCALAFCVAAFSGCGKEHPVGVSSSDAKQAACSAGQYQLSSAPQHVQKELDTNLKVDANVVLPGKNAYPTYPLTSRSFTSQELIRLFLSDDTGKKSVEAYPEDGFVSVTSSSGTVAVANNGSSVASFQKNERDSAIDSVFGEYIVREKQANRQALSTDPKDLSFMTHQEAGEKGAAILRSMHFFGEPVSSSGMIAMTGKELDAYQSKLLKSPDYKNTVKLQIVKNITEKDDCYLIEYTFQKDGLPIYGGGQFEPVVEIHGDTNTVGPLRIGAEVLLSTQGLRYLQANGTYSVKGSPSSPKPIISVDKALECLKSSYANEIISTPHNVKKIWLEYVAVPTPDKIASKAVDQICTLTPYWCFQLDFATSDKKTHTIAKRFNAFTGKDLAYGG